MKASRSFGLSFICFLCCIPGGAALLAKVYGIGEMREWVLWAALPGIAVLVLIWYWQRQCGRGELYQALTLGCLGGMLGTLGYDVARVPFALAGQRIFAPISAYGVWIADASHSSRFTEVTGWSYHLSNGITFGLMYALVLRRWHWLWAVLWAFVLESIALISPFRHIFGLSGNYYGIGIAYFGHIAYGLPLGLLTQHWDASCRWVAQMTVMGKGILWSVVAVALLWPLGYKAAIARDERMVAGEFRVEGLTLNPDWLRIDKGGAVNVFNPAAKSVKVRVVKTGVVTTVAAGARLPLRFEKTGVYQVFVETKERTHSSFVIVEPVEKLP